MQEPRRRLSIVERVSQLRSMAQLPEDQRGVCLVCGASFFAYLECKSGDCHFVRSVEDGPA